MSDPIFVVPYDPRWPERFRALGTALRGALGEIALRIDHIGSTAVPGLAAKPIIDVQISVTTLESLHRYRVPLEKAGFVFRAANPDLSKRYFREMPGDRRTHIHVRRGGSWSEQGALLFRDYLRAHEDDARAYGAVKYRLAEEYRDDRGSYAEGKASFIWEIMVQAHTWQQQVGWQPGRSDA